MSSMRGSCATQQQDAQRSGLSRGRTASCGRKKRTTLAKAEKVIAAAAADPEKFGYLAEAGRPR